MSCRLRTGVRLSEIRRAALAPIGERSIVMSASVCLSVCLSACLCLSVRNHIFANTRPIFTKFFCACYLFPWLDPLLAA